MSSPKYDFLYFFHISPAAFSRYSTESQGIIRNQTGHFELDGLASASTGLIEVNFRLQSGEASLQVAERIGADTTDFEVLFDLCREEVGQGACAGKLDIAVGIGLGLLDELLGPGNSVLIAHSLAYRNDASAQLAHNAVDIGDYVMSQKDYDEQIVHDDTVAFTDWGPRRSSSGRILG